MGNAALQSLVRFDFDLEQTSVVAGNDLRGRVVLTVNDDVLTSDRAGRRRIPATTIVLRLTGKEKARISHGEQTSVAERVLYLTRTLVRREDQWSWFINNGDGDGLSPGTYGFPFRVPIPATLPSSAKFGESLSGGEVVYSLKIDAMPNGHSTIRGAARRVFRVTSAPLPDVRVPASIAPRFLDVKSHGGMVRRGTIGITARVNDVQIGRGDLLEIYIATKNHASASIYRVQIELNERVVWKASDQTESRSRTLLTISDVNLPGIQRAKQNRAVVKWKGRWGASRNEATLTDLHRELHSERNRVSFRVPEDCRDSYSSSGDMIQVVHELRITTYTKELISNPSVTIPLQIGTSPAGGTTNSRGLGSERSAGDAANSPRAEAELVEEIQQLGPAAPTTATEVVAVPLPNSAPMTARMDSLPPSGTASSATVTEAVIIPDDGYAVEYPEATAPPQAVVVNGMAPYEYTFTNSNAEGNGHSSFDALGTPAFRRGSFNSSRLSLGTSFMCESANVASTPALDVLLQEMLYSVNDYEIIRSKLQCFMDGSDSIWKPVLAAVTPEEFGSIISHVNRDTDQPSVAVLLATEAIVPGCFTCDYGREAVLNSADWNRQAMIAMILPHCVDARENCGRIRDVLSEWDRVITRELFNGYSD